MEITIKSRYCIGDAVDTDFYGELTVVSVKFNGFIENGNLPIKESIEYQVSNSKNNLWINENDLMALQKEKANERNRN